jgi:transcriptional regulator with XRE-family HTH domain
MRLKNLRVSNGLTQSSIATAIGVSKSNYSKYERGLLEPNVQMLKALSKIFNVNIDYMLGFTNNPFVHFDLTDSECHVLIIEDTVVRYVDLTDAAKEDLKNLLCIFKKAHKL